MQAQIIQFPIIDKPSFSLLICQCADCMKLEEEMHQAGIGDDLPSILKFLLDKPEDLNPNILALPRYPKRVQAGKWLFLLRFP